MRRKTKKRYQSEPFRQLLKISIVPVLLSLAAIAYLSYNFVFHSPLSPSIVVEEHRDKNFGQFKLRELLAGQKIQSEVKATENNFGIVLVRFYNFYRISDDSVIFRIKELGQADWFYQNSYTVNQFQPNQYFTFGFPQLANSRNKTYLFEVESIGGVHGNAIGISAKQPLVALAYKFTKPDLAQNKLILLRYVFRKSIYTLANINVLVPLKIFVSTFAIIFVWRYHLKLQQLLEPLRRLQLERLPLLSISKSRSKKIKKKIYPFCKKIFRQFYVLVFWRFLSATINSRTSQKRTLIIILGTLIIFAIATIVRLSYYFDPKNVDHFIYYSLGGGGDYDNLIRNALRVIIYHDDFSKSLVTYYDYPVLLRLFGIFFTVFGFSNGLNLFILSLILLSSVTCLLPFLLLTCINHQKSFFSNTSSKTTKTISLGGFVASLYLATDPLLRILPASLVVDAVTSIIYSLFICLFILAVEKKHYLFAVALGLVAFLEGYDRAIMLINDPFVLIFFAIFIFIRFGHIHKHKPFFSISLANLFYGLLPLATFCLLYIPWEFYAKRTQGNFWFLGRALQDLLLFAGSIGQPSTGSHHLAIVPLHILALISITLDIFVRVVKIPLLLLAVVLLIYKVVDNKLAIKKTVLLILLPAVFAALLLYIRYYIAWHQTGHFTPAIFRVLAIEPQSYIAIAILLELLVLQIILLKDLFIRYFVLIAPYLLLLIYGIHFEFSNRHFTQVLFPFYIILALTLDTLIAKSLSHAKYFVLRLIMPVVITYLVINQLGLITLYTKNFFAGVSYKFRQRTYLRFASAVIPQDGIILGGWGDDLVPISSYSKRAVAYNVSHDSFLIPQQYHPRTLASNASIDTVPKDQIADIFAPFQLARILKSNEEYTLYNFYVLDTDIALWQRILSQQDLGFYIDANQFAVRPFAVSKANRVVYQLVKLPKEPEHK